MSKVDAVWKNMEGLTLLQNGKYKEALRLFNEAIEIDPEYLAAWFNRSITNRKLGKEAEAKTDLEKWEILKNKLNERDAGEVPRGLHEMMMRNEAVIRFKESQKRYEEEVNLLKELPENWKYKYIRNILVAFLILSVSGILLLFFGFPKEKELSFRLVIVSIVVILGTILYAAGTLNKTPLVKYRFIRSTCGFLRFIYEKGP